MNLKLGKMLILSLFGSLVLGACNGTSTTTTATTLTDLEKIEADLEAIEFSSYTVSANITLPTKGDHGTDFYWSSHNPTVIAIAGGVGNVHKQLTATEVKLSVEGVLGNTSADKDFNFTVTALTADDKVDAAMAAITDPSGTVEDNFDLPLKGLNDVAIAWTSQSDLVTITNKDANNDLATITKELNVTNEAKITASFSLTGATTKAKEFTFSIAPRTLTDKESTDADLDYVLDLLAPYIRATDPQKVTTNLSFVKSGPNGSTLSYALANDDESAITANGIITRTNADKTATITVTATKGLQNSSEEITMTIAKNETFGANELWKATFEEATSSLLPGAGNFGWDNGSVVANPDGTGSVLKLDPGTAEADVISHVNSNKAWNGVVVSFSVYLATAESAFAFDLRDSSAGTDLANRKACVAFNADGISPCNSAGATTVGYDVAELDLTEIAAKWHNFKFYVKDGNYKLLYQVDGTDNWYWVTSPAGVNMGAKDKTFNWFRIRSAKEGVTYLDNVTIDTWDGSTIETSIADVPLFIRGTKIDETPAIGGFHLVVTTNKSNDYIYYSLREHVDADTDEIPDNAPVTLADYQDVTYLNGNEQTDLLDIDLDLSSYDQGDYNIFIAAVSEGEISDTTIVDFTYAEATAIDNINFFTNWQEKMPVGKKYQITADLDFAEVPDVRLHEWYGIIDGGNHKIKNLNYEYDSATDTQNSNSALFTQSANPGGRIVLSNIIFDGINLTLDPAGPQGKIIAFGVIGNNYGGADFYNVHVNNISTPATLQSSEINHLSSFVGRARGADFTFEQCSTNGSTIHGRDYVSILGHFENGTNCVKVKDCEFYGTLKPNKLQSSEGLLIGRTSANTVVEIENVIIGVDVLVKQDNANNKARLSIIGGVINYADSSIKNVYYSGDMKIEGTSDGATGNLVIGGGSATGFAQLTTANLFLSPRAGKATTLDMSATFRVATTENLNATWFKDTLGFNDSIWVFDTDVVKLRRS